MSEIQKLQFEDVAQADTYIDQVRELYRQGHGEYRGQRNEEQKIIAELTSDEARQIVDGAMLGILAVGSGGKIKELPADYETKIETGGHNWAAFRGEFERLLVGFGVITNRLQRDGYNVPSYADLNLPDRIKAASALFSDFLELNALRFGTTGSGIPASKRRPMRDETGKIALDEDGFPRSEVYIEDRDKASSDAEIERNMDTRGYATGVAAHPAAKLSPEMYQDLRRTYPEMDKDAFDRDVSFYTNVIEEFANRE